MDAHGADDLVRRDAERGDRDQRDRDGVGVVAIVAREDALLLAEDAPPQRRGLAALPSLGRELHAVLGRKKRGEWIEDHAHAPCGCRAPRS